MQRNNFYPEMMRQAGSRLKDANERSPKLKRSKENPLRSASDRKSFLKKHQTSKHIHKYMLEEER